MATTYFGSDQESLGYPFPFLVIYNPIYYTTKYWYFYIHDIFRIYHFSFSLTQTTLCQVVSPLVNLLIHLFYTHEINSLPSNLTGWFSFNISHNISLVYKTHQLFSVLLSILWYTYVACNCLLVPTFHHFKWENFISI